jgi:hypothetical protein
MKNIRKNLPIYGMRGAAGQCVQFTFFVFESQEIFSITDL